MRHGVQVGYILKIVTLSDNNDEIHLYLSLLYLSGITHSGIIVKSDQL